MTDTAGRITLGMLTACLPDWSLDRIAAWAAETGYEALEVAAWPSVRGREFEASHLPVADFGPGEAERTRALFDRHGLTLSALAYYENNLHPDPARRTAVHTHLRRCIDAAALLEVPYVGTFIGRDPTRSVPENMREAEKVVPELVEYAGARGVQIIIENCVMEGWHPDGYPGNIAYSPELWEWMFDLGLYLNWDPSHLMWIGVDPVETILPYAHRIAHAQAKDVELDARSRNRFGVFGTVHKDGDPWRTGWWRYRVPGRGHVDWSRIVDRLYEAGFTGTLSVEHEDPVWGGTDDRILTGLRIAHRTLQPLVIG
jgi:sugar phosphate isomerase/epimerase